MPGATVAALRASNLAGKSTLRDDRAVRVTEREREHFAILRRAFEDIWTTSMILYTTKDIETFYNGRSKVRLPTAFLLNERVIPRVVKATVGRGRFWEARPRTPLEIDKTRNNEALLNAQLAEDRFHSKVPAFLRETAVLGTGVWKNNWLYDVRRAPLLKHAAGEWAWGPDGPVEQETAEYVLQERVMHNGPHGERVDPYQVYIDPRDCSEGATVIEEQTLTFTQLQSLVKQGLFDKAMVDRVVKENEGAVRNDDRGENAAAERDAVLNLDRYHEAFYGERRYQYRERWGAFPVETKEGDPDTAETVPCLIGVIGKVCVMLRRNPYNSQRDPYQFCRLITFPGCRYGLSLTHMNLGLFIEEHDLHNQTADARTYALIPMLAVPPGSRKRGSYTAFPGKVVEAEKVTQFAYPDLTATGIVGMRHTRQLQEDAFGAPSILSGEPISGESGATGAAIRQQEANVRIQAMAEEAEESFVKPMLETWHDFNEQFLDTTRRVLVQGEQGFEHRVITRADVVGQYDFMPLGSSQMQARQLLAANYASLTPLLIEIDAMNPGAVDLQRWAADILRDVFEKDHPEVYIKAAAPDTRPRTFNEVGLLLSLGHRVKPDPRVDPLEALTEYGAFMEKYGDRLEEDLRRDLSEYGAELLAMAQAKIAEAEAAQMGPAPGMGAPGAPGSAPPPTGPAQRDGQGLGMGRRLMVAARGGPQGRGRAA